MTNEVVGRGEFTFTLSLFHVSLALPYSLLLYFPFLLHLRVLSLLVENPEYMDIFIYLRPKARSLCFTMQHPEPVTEMPSA